MGQHLKHAEKTDVVVALIHVMDTISAAIGTQLGKVLRLLIALDLMHAEAGLRKMNIILNGDCKFKNTLL